MALRELTPPVIVVAGGDNQVDGELSSESERAVQNKVITAALGGIANEINTVKESIREIASELQSDNESWETLDGNQPPAQDTTNGNNWESLGGS